MTTITPLSTPPNRSDPATFSARTDTLLGELPAFVTQTNAVAGEVNAAAVTATTQAGLATTNGAAQVALAEGAAAAAAQSAMDATSNGAAQVALAEGEVAAAAQSAMDATSNGAAQVALAAQQVALAAAQAAASAASANIAAASANFKGAWASLTGALAMPASTRYGNTYWLLLADLADVATAEPGVSGSWARIETAAAALSGDTTVYVTQEKTYTITNYNSFSTYAVAAVLGSASITGDTITYTAPGASGAETLTVTVDGENVVFSLTILPAGIAAPTITSPASGATGVTETTTITTSAFSWIGESDTHLNSDWELWTGPNRTGTLIASSYADADNLTSWPVAAGVMSVNTTYYPAVLHRGTTLGGSAWGVSSFTTAATFNSWIATPAATPAAFGDPFEGGFYAGLFWDQIAQSADSKALGTGTQTFTVPDMTSAAIVYEGQSLEVRSRANPANKFVGTVTGAIGTTLTLNVSSIGGSGTFSDWSVMARFRSIDAPKASGEHADIALKNAATEFPTGCQSLVNGWAATEAMRLAGDSTEYPAAHWARSLSIGGHADWYIPARDELELRWRNLKPVIDDNYATADRAAAQSFDYKRDGAYGDTANTHGTNNNSSPTGPANTSSVPGRTAATTFRTGGAEAYTYGSSHYWSSTEYRAADAWRQSWDSLTPGYQRGFGKASRLRVRAVRRSIL